MHVTDPSVDQPDSQIPEPQFPKDSPQGIMGRRYIAGCFDNLLAMILALVVANQLPDSQPAIQVAVMVATYLAYYLVSEGLFYTSPVKYLTGLTIRNYGGGPCTFRQTIIRTLMRILEVNLLLLGCIPAALAIFFTRDKQRFGDQLARTVVVRR
ncbi:RDD family protein [Gimesia panareensis]|uniref:RDD family protein n=1 Tax=Gimesia panareensis TaxID=2527978 RepID=A0A518FTA4_9PLAN|nr:RDD family protein [Gimesia panareensis]QDV19571.1 RDD family protein [Gimesia panareensis]